MNKDDFNNMSSKYKDNVYAIAFNYFRNKYDAEDVVQEVFIKLYGFKKSFESEEHIRNWLIRVTINQCKKITFSSWFKKKVTLEDYINELQYEDLSESELMMDVMKLPKKYRMVIHLYYYEDYSVKEISKILKLSETAVSTRLMRAREMLKTKLEVWKDE